MAESKKTTDNKHSTFIKSYLIGYNTFQTVGWFYLLVQLINHYTSTSTETNPLYSQVKWTVIIFQNASILEVVHAVIRIVPSNPVVTALQIASRLFIVNGILIPTVAAKETYGLPLALFAWSITEVIRYGNYALNLMDAVPHFITWLRYSTFIVLYPLGVTGELLCAYAAQGEVETTKLFTVEMPNSLNFIFNYRLFIWFVMFLYIPIFPKLYNHMLTLRRKVLGVKEKVN